MWSIVEKLAYSAMEWWLALAEVSVSVLLVLTNTSIAAKIALDIFASFNILAHTVAFDLLVLVGQTSASGIAYAMSMRW